jgi:hypothetical protein
MTSSPIRVCATLVVICLAGGSVLTQRAGSIDTISPAAARPGDSVTITGRGFGAINVRITVGGVPADVVAATGSRVTFRVPEGVAQGATTVTAINPGGQSGSIAFQIIEGVLLPGAANALASTAETLRLPTSANRADIDDGLILTRLDVRITAAATVGQVNAALLAVNGGIDSMHLGGLGLTIVIPRQPLIDAIEAIIARLRSMPGIAFALPAQESAPLVLPPGAQSVGNQAFPTRFPAAWNAKRLALQDCTTRRVPILVADGFTSSLPAGYADFSTEIPPTSFAVPDRGQSVRGVPRHHRRQPRGSQRVRADRPAGPLFSIDAKVSDQSLERVSVSMSDRVQPDAEREHLQCRLGERQSDQRVCPSHNCRRVQVPDA